MKRQDIASELIDQFDVPEHYDFTFQDFSFIKIPFGYLGTHKSVIIAIQELKADRDHIKFMNKFKFLDLIKKIEKLKNENITMGEDGYLFIRGEEALEDFKKNYK